MFVSDGQSVRALGGHLRRWVDWETLPGDLTADDVKAATEGHRLVAGIVEGVIHPLSTAPRVEMGDRHHGQGVDNPANAVRVAGDADAAPVDATKGCRLPSPEVSSLGDRNVQFQLPAMRSVSIGGGDGPGSPRRVSPPAPRRDPPARRAASP